MGFLGGTHKPRFRKVRVPKGKETLLLGQKGVFSLSSGNTIPAKLDFRASISLELSKKIGIL